MKVILQLLLLERLEDYGEDARFYLVFDSQDELLMLQHILSQVHAIHVLLVLLSHDEHTVDKTVN